MRPEDRDIAIHVAYDDYDAFDPVTPEKNLLRAVLMSALTDLKKQGELSRKATEFFMNQDEDYLFSFRAICDYLSIDPSKILVVTGLTHSKEGNGKLATIVAELLPLDERGESEKS